MAVPHPLADGIISNLTNSLTKVQKDKLTEMDEYLRVSFGRDLGIKEPEKNVKIITPPNILMTRLAHSPKEDPWQYIVHFKYFNIFNYEEPLLILWMNETTLLLKIRQSDGNTIPVYEVDGTNTVRLVNELNNNLQERRLPIKF
tara:strand:+ start:95 stop:526 length:432 start_codon:yes stop_codon:yes gene_type:complete